MSKSTYLARGFSLVELMVAMTLALVAMLAATELYTNTRQTYRIQGMQSRLAEDGRYAMSMLQRVLLQANFRTNPVAAAVAGFVTPDASTPATKFQIQFNGDNINTVDCSGAPVAGTPTVLTVYKSSTQLQCDTTGGASGTWVSGSGTELASFSVKYGVDTSAPAGTVAPYLCGASGDCVADSYVTTGITNSQIVAVRICMVLRSTETDASVTRAAAYVDCGGANIAASTTDHKLYRTFNSTVLIRNR